MEGAEEVGVQKGMKKGLKQGRAEGRAEGEYTKALEIARKMKGKGSAVADIQELTGLSEEEIQEL